ncbi:zinc ribbon domain-containing protein [Neobacillus vireti]|uniref:Membrane-associated protein n=1 Tax=Neobacillus vireti LMG 21834 TaxID=1131730 RepID=A0AB94IRE9_9BACI|nr:zinc-ribbon domain-containing protein [Neobacillus vireti]ETI69655.1 hypothetical protein BAVI_06314 [Neobacillus vireti LMG 21834]KLT18246.1 hypothetical protein AA980_07860 [Neobacillus vireti]
MSFCRNCGHQLSPHQAFCKNCGTKAGTASKPSSGGEKTTIVTAPEPQMRSGHGAKGSLSTPVKWVLAIVLILAAGLIGAHLYVSKQFTAEKAVEEFENAVTQKDYQSLRAILEKSGTDAQLSEEELKGYAAFLTKDNHFEQIIKDLKEEAAGTEFSPIVDGAENKLVTLVEGPKKFLLYKQYFIKAFPFTVQASSNLEDTKVPFNGKSKLLKKPGEEVTLGKVLPGSLTLKGVYTGKYVTLTSETAVDFKEASDNIVTAALELDGKYVTIYSNGDDADIYANGKKTGLKTGNFDSFGPVSTDGSVEIYAVLNRASGAIKSNVVKIEREGEVNLQFKELAAEQEKEAAKSRVMDVLARYAPNASPKEQMYMFMSEYVSRSVQAFNSRDFSMISSYLSPTGPAYAETEKYIAHLEQKGITEEFVNVEILDMQATETGFKVTTREEYNIFYQDSPNKHMVFESIYTLEAEDFGLREYSLDKTTTIKSEDIQ